MPVAAAAPPSSEQGWLYHLLTWAGVDDPTAAHVQQVLVKPVSVILIAVVAFLVAWLGSRIIRHSIATAARKAAERRGSARASARTATVAVILANAWRIAIGTIAFLVIMETIGVNLTPLLAGATVVGATIGFGAQSLVRDLLSGFLLIVEDQFDIGDTLVVGDVTGAVEDLTLRVTRLRDSQGTVWTISNGEIRQLGNKTRRRRGASSQGSPADLPGASHGTTDASS